MRLAYLCNVYPAVSHSFVRREIEGIEAAGHNVHRFSLRPPQRGLKDEADMREVSATEVVLSQGVGRLLLTPIRLLMTRPLKTFAALTAALRISGPGFKRKTRHMAYWLEAAWLVRRMDRLGIEHLHAHFGTNPAAVAAIARAWGGPPFSFTAHGPEEFDAPLELGLPAKIKASAFVVAISSYCRSQLMRWTEPEYWNKIELIRCGADAGFLEEPVQPVPAGSSEFVCVARLSAQKGLSLLIAACDRLREAGTPFALTIIGDGELRADLEQDIQRRGLGHCVFLAGIKSSAEIREHLSRARAFVLPSFAEGLPVVLMEALAVARPVIATAIAGIPELVDDECGWLITAGSDEALADAMRSALEASPAELAKKTEIGRMRVGELHNAGRNAALLIDRIASPHVFDERSAMSRRV